MSVRNAPPNYRLHKARNLAVVTVGGRDFYLGPYGSFESYCKYQELLSRWISGKFKATVPVLDAQQLPASQRSVAFLILKYWKFVGEYYRKDGEPTDEQDGIKSALRYLRALYGHTGIDEFRPLSLKRVRDEMIKADLSRKTINQYVERVKRMFRWGVENELVKPDTYRALAEVAGLRKNRSQARENEPVLPVSTKDVEATLPSLSSIVQAMVKVQWLTGCRPGEICVLRPCDLDRAASVWCYRPHKHKTDHLDHERRIYIGAKAQEILLPWLVRDPDSYCFSPKESARLEKSALPRNMNRTNQERATLPRSESRGRCYTAASYRRAITRACARASVPTWSPNQLRHSRATELREKFGLEAAQTVLGHTKADVTQIYAERDFGRAAAIMEELG